MSVSNEIPSSENWLVAVGKVDPTMPLTQIQLDSGRIVSVPTALLMTDTIAATSHPAQDAASMTIPVLAEELVVGKRQVPLETVRLTRTVESRTEVVEVPLLKEHWEITRVPCEVEVPERHGARQDGETTVYPVFEERTITRTALYLIEEVRLQKVSEVRNQRIEQTLQRDVLLVERLQP